MSTYHDHDTAAHGVVICGVMVPIAVMVIEDVDFMTLMSIKYWQ